ncbi:hypothetical protein D1007_12026 [Hordeum vulgare]|nr:hypothetical protein D1007_12026 [Hordeum vulgare]
MVVRGHQDLDADIVRWGLHHLLDGDACVHRPQSPTTDYAPPPPQPHRASALLDAPALAEVRVGAVDNDEVITHALQEELVQVAMAEASETAAGEPDRRATVLAQHWFRPEVVTHLPFGITTTNLRTTATGRSYSLHNKGIKRISFGLLQFEGDSEFHLG